MKQKAHKPSACQQFRFTDKPASEANSRANADALAAQITAADRARRAARHAIEDRQARQVDLW